MIARHPPLTASYDSLKSLNNVFGGHRPHTVSASDTSGTGPALPVSFDRSSRFKADQRDYMQQAARGADTVGPGSYARPGSSSKLIKRSFNVTFSK